MLMHEKENNIDVQVATPTPGPSNLNNISDNDVDNMTSDPNVSKYNHDLCIVNENQEPPLRQVIIFF